jgi:hypothetical protein
MVVLNKIYTRTRDDGSTAASGARNTICALPPMALSTRPMPRSALRTPTCRASSAKWRLVYVFVEVVGAPDHDYPNREQNADRHDYFHIIAPSLAEFLFAIMHAPPIADAFSMTVGSAFIIAYI